MLRVASYLAENARPVHERLAAYVGRRLGEPVEFLRGVSWPERLRLLDEGRVHVGFLCGWPYAQRSDRGDRPIEVSCAPVMAASRYGGQPIYFTDVIVSAAKPFRAFADLRGRSYAFNDPDSHSGYNVPRDHLLGLGETSGYFGRVVGSGSHQTSIQLVASEEIDAAGIDSTVLELELDRRPELSSRLRVIATLGPSPIPPVVVARGLPAATKQRLRDAFLEADRDPEGRAILAAGRMARFVAVEDQDYDPIRAMVRRAEKAGFLELR